MHFLLKQNFLSDPPPPSLLHEACMQDGYLSCGALIVDPSSGPPNATIPLSLELLPDSTDGILVDGDTGNVLYYRKSLINVDTPFSVYEDIDALYVGVDTEDSSIQGMWAKTMYKQCCTLSLSSNVCAICVQRSN